MDYKNNKIDLYAYFYGLVRQIPYGMVSTYGDLAIALGDVIASRAVGEMLSQNPDPGIIPCHRVVKGDGSIGGFTHPEGVRKKVELLESEGIKIENKKIINFEKVRFRDFQTEYPLKKLRESETELYEKISFEDCDFEKIFSYDVSYNKRDAYIAKVEFDINLNIIDYKLKKVRVDFPYIPTYLFYREGLLLLDEKPSGLGIIDGNGILHPRKLGIATFLGILWEMPTIGIAKSLLLGNIKDDKIYVNGELRGFSIKKRFVSPGNRISLKKTYALIKDLLVKGDPVKPAHELAKHFMESERQRQ
ncbi:MAG: endonuclease V [Thermoplasmata archaeon]